MKNRRCRYCSIAFLGVLAHGALAYAADEDFEFWPNAEYDAAIPTIKEVLGHDPGERITTPGDVIVYFEALAAVAPDRLKLQEYAQSWEGRRLVYATISSAENISRLSETQAAIQTLADPRLSNSAEAENLIASLPATVWLAYSVHGDEISPSDAAMLMAYHLLASNDNDQIDHILQNTIVFIDPIQNPDGRNRFIHNATVHRGLMPDENQLSAEHNQPWPSGRSNHYLFDMNRDYFAVTQPETRGRIRNLQEWYPLIVSDFHEMSGDSTYYFPPEAKPYNAHITPEQRDSLRKLGRNHARWFDEFGIRYFTAEDFDTFYPGYEDAWPMYYGSVSMTYEQASAGGLRYRRNDGTVLSYRDSVRNQFVVSVSTAETAANNRESLLRNFRAHREAAVEKVRRGETRAYILSRQEDYSAADKLAGLLALQGVEVGEAEEAFGACGRRFESGTYIVESAQPAKLLVQTLLDKHVPMDNEFLEIQEYRRAKDLNLQIADVTAWSLPLMFNVDVTECEQTFSVATREVQPELFKPSRATSTDAKVAYVVPWGTVAAMRLLSRSLLAGLVAYSNDEAFTVEGRSYPGGSLIFNVAGNPENLGVMLDEFAVETGAQVVALDDSWVSAGTNLGSDKVVRIDAPRVAIAWDEPTSSLSAGATRFVVERQFDYPVTAIRTSVLSSANLSRFHVLILPGQDEDSYDEMLGEDGAANLRRWVESGGVLIGLGTAMRYLTDPKIDLLSSRRENAIADTVVESESGDDTAESLRTVQGQKIVDEESYRKAIQPEREAPDFVQGALVAADVDPDHWLAAGVAKRLNVLVHGSDIYSPVRLDDGVNVARFASADKLLMSGYLWKENQEQLANKPFVVAQATGDGFVIGFTQDPNFRAYLDGLNAIFMNAIFRGSAHADPIR